jgi:nucleotide-binding universal stress UspA family protein
MSEATLQNVSRHSSPALRGFESNPFRVLRLAANASTSEASFQAERALTMMRAGLPPAGEDVLPWLPPASVYEAQQAAQTVEEPLARLSEQLFWFDLTRDRTADSLQSVLRGLTEESLQKYFDGEAGLPMPEKCNPEDAASVPLVAQAINQANLRLLVAASLVNGVGIRKADAPAQLRKIARDDWRRMYGLRALPDAHNVIAGSLSSPDAALSGRYWERALRRWARILQHPWFRPYLARCIADLEDDFVSPDDAETIEESVRTRLADLASHETRFLLLGGHYALASEMISALAQSGLEKRVLVPALRPIHHIFQSEVAELQTLLDGSGEDGLRQLDAYLKRLAAIKRRWTKIDQARLVGLGHILDDALEQAFLRLRSMEKPDAQSDALLESVSQLAAAKSLRERVSFYRTELEEARKRLCNFCKTGVPDIDKSVVLEGRKETERVENIVYIGTEYRLILRCERCARFHDFLWKWGWLSMWCVFPAMCFIIVPLTGFAFVLFWYGAVRTDQLGAVAVFIPRLVSELLSSLFAMFVTPAGHRRYGRCGDLEPMRTLRGEGNSVRTHWPSDAYEKLKNK